jgi:hypothetical protein
VLIGGRKPAARWNFLRVRVFTPISYRICQPNTTEITRRIRTIDFTKDLCELLPKHDTQYPAVAIAGNLLVLATEMEGSPVRHERIRSSGRVINFSSEVDIHTRRVAFSLQPAITKLE